MSQSDDEALSDDIDLEAVARQIDASADYHAALDQHLRAAASGIGEAQRIIAHAATTVAQTLPAGEMLAVSRTWARIVATHGFRADAFHLAGVLLISASAAYAAGAPDAADAYKNEALQALAPFAAVGDDEAGNLSRRIIEDTSWPISIAIPEATAATAYLASADIVGSA